MPVHPRPPRDASAGDPAVRFEGAVRRYGPLHAVGPIDLAVRPGTCTALTGPTVREHLELTADVLALLRRHRRPPGTGDTAFAVCAALSTAVLILPPLVACTGAPTPRPARPVTLRLVGASHLRLRSNSPVTHARTFHVLGKNRLRHGPSPRTTPAARSHTARSG
ncbi:hypothetical protein [Nocardiopsis sp. CNT312]|uniref:hypothetical protein n=1 Tax=Nocardiopsis sp. CNT312 TaxID=1137268 RepID=UPI0012DEB7AF|nr:hypothetical protein [Nocardiopsis sp. CNT312]